MEQRGINPQGVALLAASVSYLLAKPGVLQGMIDTYVAAPLQRYRSQVYSREDFRIGKKVATGGFGTVYRAELKDPQSGAIEQVIVKKATEFGEAEVWMNERMMRASPSSIARFITAFADGDTPREGGPLFLSWAYEGDTTLADLMVQRNFPANLEALLFDRPLKISEGANRRAVVLRLAIRQLIEALKACHIVGIVHRDVKPQNSIISEAERRVKLIDFGAAADLRVGINYVPNQYLLDPRYAPPEQYVMPESTPRAPPAPVAAFLSPVLWQLNGPDRFDMYSVGVTLLQLALPPLRNDNNLIAFNRNLKEVYNFDLNAWRSAMEKRQGKEWAEGFATLDALSGGGWDLAQKLMAKDPSARLSATAALAHPWFDPSPLESVASTVEGLRRNAASSLADVDDGWLQRQITRSGEDVGVFTEMQLREELGVKTTSNRGKGMPQGSATVAWWVDRQNDVQSRLKDRKGNGAGNGGVNSNSNGVSKAAANSAGKDKGMNVLQAFAPKMLAPKVDGGNNKKNSGGGSGSGGKGGKKPKSNNKVAKGGGGGIIGLVGLKGKGK
jgi:serine/threonine protein kinase